jgi:phosphotransferase system IIB component
MEKTVQKVIDAVGGKDHISSYTSDMTRLHLSLKDTNYADTKQVKSIAGVFGVIKNNEQYQIILRPGKAKKAPDMLNELVA